MDLDFAFWLAIALIYLLQFFLGKKKGANSPETVPELEGASPSTETSSEFKDALAEISEMLGGPVPEPASAPPPTPTPAPKKQPSLSSQKVFKSTLKPVPSLHERKIASSGSSFYDEEFERKDFADFHIPEITRAKSILAAPIAKTRKASISQLAKRDIHDMDKAREALILAEVLGPPVCRKPRKRVI